MRPTDHDLLVGIRAFLADVVAPEVGNSFVRQRLTTVVNLLGMLADRWDIQVQRLLDEQAFLAASFARAAAALAAIDEAPADLAVALREAARSVPVLSRPAGDGAGPAPADFRLSALVERTDAMNALLVRLMETCDLALERPALAPLLPLRAELLHHVRAQAAARASQPYALPAARPAAETSQNGDRHAQPAR
jgi:hypothetical protein